MNDRGVSKSFKSISARNKKFLNFLRILKTRESYPPTIVELNDYIYIMEDVNKYNSFIVWSEEMDYPRKILALYDRQYRLLLFIMCLLLFCISGCIKLNTDEDFQFDNSILDQLIRQDITNGTLYCNDGRGGYGLTPQQSCDILKAMKPVTHIGNGMINYEKTGYSFSFQFGMNPAVFEILVDGDALTIGFHNKIYSGGSTALFLEAIKPIIGVSFNQHETEYSSANEHAL